MKCDFCNSFLDADTPSSDPDYPAFRVCRRKLCARRRDKLSPQQRLEQYEAVSEQREQEAAARQLRQLEGRRESARQSRGQELRQFRIQKFGNSAVEFAEKLAAGGLVLQTVYDAADAARIDERSVKALSDTEVDALVEQYDQDAKARQLKVQRLRASEIPRYCYGPAVVGVHIGKLSPGHAEVRRQVAAAHQVTWTEADLPDNGGIQSWFVCSDHDFEVCKVLSAVAAAELQPIVQTLYCHMCGKDVGLEYSRERLWVYTRHYQTFNLCTRPECLVQRDRVVQRTQDYEVDRHGLTKHLYQHSAELYRKKKFKPVTYPAPGPLPIAPEDQKRLDRYRAEQESPEPRSCGGGSRDPGLNELQ